MSLALTHLIGFGSRRPSVGGGGGGASGNDAFTKILLHFDGSDGSTSFVDSNAGGSAHTWTANGDAQLDTAQLKFGTASGLFDGSGDYISAPDHADFSLGSSDWVIDFWLKTAVSGLMYICGQCDGAGSTSSIAAYVEKTAGNVLRVAVNVGGSIYSVAGTTAVNTGAQVHCAAVRSSNTLKLYVNGVKEGTDASGLGAINDSGSPFGVGGLGVYGFTRFNGWLDEFRLSVGTDRGWNGASFSVPTAPYS
ncbi:MAG: LamG domain-containing protein [Desulfurellales bacterium]|nr:MAG: LamG domain-containing protein [Desulfurellales bacterium]